MGRLLITIRNRIWSAICAWDEFWFKPMAPTTLGVIRILSGLMLLYTHAVWGLGLDAFFGANGWQDPLLIRSQAVSGSTGISFWWYVQPEYYQLVHWCCMVLLLMFTIGMLTRVTACAAFIITVSYATRALNANFGLDQINGFLTLYLALAPCGDALSFDAWWARRQARRKGLPVIEPIPRASTRLATRLIQVHLCLLYFFAGVSKLKGEAWWNGDAVWMAVANREYQSQDLTWLAWHPWVSHLLTHMTVLWEMTFFIAVWNRAWRPLVLAIGIGVHLGIGSCLGLWTFGLIMLVPYLSFISPETMYSVLVWVRAIRPVQVLSPVEANPVETVSWWPQYKHIKFTGWPFAACDRLDINAPRLHLVCDDSNLCGGLLTDLTSAGFHCQTSPDIADLCTALEHHPVDVLLLIAHDEDTSDDIIDFRRILLQMGAATPASVAVLIDGETHDLRHSDAHICLYRQPLFEQLRRSLLLALCERTATEEEADQLRQRAGVVTAPSLNWTNP
ncbi:MAG: HTTM domain-containing protein [Planctomycetaceae bacterium]|nr:HTTM domain-containing protein [Planctomycetaceae bacterium]